MATRTFELETRIAAEPSAVIDFMMDLSRHRGLHPFFVTATVSGSGENDRGTWTDWRVTERPRVGPLHYTIRFPARMIRTSETSMACDVHAAPGCNLVTNTSARRSDGDTILTETTTVTAPRLLVGYMTSQAHEAHARTYRLLPGEFGAQSYSV